MASTKKTVKKRKPRLDLSFVPRAAQDILVRKNQNGTVSIIKIEDEENFYHIDGMAAEAWMLIDGRKPLKKIYDRLAAKHSPSIQLKTDLQKFAVSLVNLGLIDRP